MESAAYLPIERRLGGAGGRPNLLPGFQARSQAAKQWPQQALFAVACTSPKFATTII